jgi:amino acid adenylation domain-containing protein
MRSARPGQGAREAVVSFAQRRVWLAEQITPGTPAYHIFVGLRLRGRLDVAALRRAVSTIYERHHALRTGFRPGREDVMQFVGPPLAVPLPLTDLSGLPASARDEQVEQAMRQARDTPFGLSTGEVLRASLLRTDADEHLLLITVHHIVFDAWSWGIFRRELQTCYNALVRGEPVALPPLPLQYADFAVRQRSGTGGARLAEQLEYWRHQLRDLPDTELCGSRPRPANPHWQGSRLAVTLPDDLARRLGEFSRANRATASMTYLSAFQVLLGRYRGARDLAVASPVAGRTSADVEDLIGLFINTLVLRADLSGNPRFVELLARTRDTALDAYSNQEVSFDHVVDELGPPRTLANPFTQVLFGLQNAPGRPLELDGLDIERVAFDASATKMDLRLNVTAVPGGSRLSWGYRTELFERGDIERINRHYVTILQAVAADPTRRIDDLPLLGTAEREEVLAAGRGGPLAERPYDTLHERFGRQARVTPYAPAVLAADGRLSYQELEKAAGMLAARLRAAGTARGDLVAIMIDRSAAMAVAVLAVLRAGAAYVPVDPTLPPARTASLLADAAPRVLLVAGGWPELDPGSASVLPVDVAELLHDPGPPAEPVAVTGADLAYVLYTSGSTGRPKGVAVTHTNVLSYLESIDKVAGLAAGRFAMVQPLAVDSSVTMLYGAWFRGGVLYPVAREVALDAAALARLMVSEQIDYLKIAPSHLEALQRAGSGPELLPRRWVMIGGEASGQEWAREVAATRPGCGVYNHYGPTETTVGVLVHPVRLTGDTAGTTPLGRPVAGTDSYVIDAAGTLAPPLVTGELCVAGSQVARGYLNRAAQTAAQFVADPFSTQPGARMYRTGDRARMHPDGTIEFLGREDDQVKIRGNRVELGDIAAALRAHPQVREAIVRALRVAGTPTLVGYVTGRAVAAPGRPDQDSLRAFLRQRLPDHMVPDAVVVMDSLPLTRHGKVDVGALPAAAPVPAARGGAEPPTSPAERRIAEIWGRMLGVEAVSRRDNFFHLGGHSLLATRVAAEVAAAFDADVPVATLFSHPTPAALATYLEQAATAPARRHLAPLVRFSRGSEAAVLVCVHPISGTVGCYAALARHLSAYTVAAVESQALRTGGAPPDSVPALADRYVADVREAYGQRPYLLAGWSMGGLVAYEMGQRLAAAGRHADRIILFDTVVPREHPRPLSDAELAVLMVRDMAASLGLRLDREATGQLATFDHAQGLTWVRRWLSDSGAAPDGMPADELERRFAVFRANHRAQSHYRPPPSAVPVTLVRPVAHSRRSQGWRGLVAERLLTVQAFDADHYSLLREPTVAQVADWLRRHLVAQAQTPSAVTGRR